MAASKQYQVVIADRARDMLLELVRFVAQPSQQGADSLRIKIIESAKSLESFPERHPWLSEPMLPAHKYRKMVIDKRYVLLYQVKNDYVYIDYILDCRQSYQWLL